MKDKRTYTKIKDYDHDMSYENESRITAGEPGTRDIQIEEKDKLIQELRMRIRDMLIISEQHRSILGNEITDRKRLEKEVKELKVQMSEYLSVRVKGARDNAG